MRVRDYQKEELYSWERNLGECHWPAARIRLDLSEVRAFVRCVCVSYRCPEPEVIQVEGSQLPATATGWTKVTFPPNMMERWIVCHEVAHIIVNYIFRACRSNKKLSDHGPVFLGTYMRIMHDFLDIPFEVMMDTADEVSLDFIIPGCCNRIGLVGHRSKYGA